jgi:mono/diheme cytochrome c family protein
MTVRSLCPAAFALALVAAPAPAAEPPADPAREAGALLKARCLPCHGDDAKKLGGGLDLRTRESALRGGDSGEPALVPGEPDKSRLYTAVTRRDPDLAMPPKENDKLSVADVETIRRWIAAGAPWPAAQTAPVKAWDPTSADGVPVVTSGGRTPDWTTRKYKPEDLWAYQPVKRHAIPEIRNPRSAIRNPIDAFLCAKLLEKGISKRAPPADKRTLIRRVTFDLTGLPPAPADVEAFLEDDDPGAYERLVDRLLASPRYAEQQARHWLDAVRYADSGGFANDHERPHAWRYRDYVVRSFAADKPYDRFLVEQIAGDELDPDDPQMLIAVGFLRMGPWEHTGMSVAAITRQQYLDDVTHAVGVTVLAQGLRCARCHDHKFDPVPTKDYYRLQAVFAPTQLAERPVPFLPVENTAHFAEGKARAERRLAEAKAVVARLSKKSDNAIAAFLKEKGVQRLTDLPENMRPNRQRYGLDKPELSLLKTSQKRVEAFERAVARYEAYALSVYDGPPNNYNSNKVINPVPARRGGPAPAVHVLVGGSLEAPADEVTPGVLSVISDCGLQIAGSRDTGPEPSADPGGLQSAIRNPQSEIRDTARRLALARWLTDPRHPLTVRVIVNRVWQQHFGRGIVATPNNFGKMGAKPSHPELLDWLAAWFVDHGWSLKALHRLILTSDAYRQASEIAHFGFRIADSKASPSTATPYSNPQSAIRNPQSIDPNNALLAYFPPRRLAAEELRDALLAVTGELNPAEGGPPAYPEIHWDVALQPRHVMGSVGPAYQPDPRPEQRHRPTLYAVRIRTLADPLLEVFNRPGSETSCECRDQTTVTPQVFALFNGEFAHDRALALAAAVTKRADDLDGRVREAFRRCYGRLPDDAELAASREHVARMTAHHRQHPPVPTEPPRRVRRSMVEEMTGEEYAWDEELDGMAGYVRDLKPWQVGPDVRALADLCLVLMNSNEFLYVR